MPVLIGTALFLWMAGVMYGAFVYAPPAEGLGETSRLIFLHVPVAWTSVMAFITSFVYSILVLRRNRHEDDIRAEVAARMGLWYCVLATITGAFWAKATWNTYWNWDPREISIVVLLLVYMSYFGLRSAVTDPDKKIRLAAVYAILAAIIMPFLVFVVPRMYMSLHPDTLINNSGKSQLADVRMKQVFFFSLAGFTLLYFWLFNLSVRIERLVRRKEGWNV
ncbi:MAG: cytochrome c biogenesis protein [bacterium]